MKKWLKVRFARWCIVDCMGTKIHTHSWTDAMDWLKYCGAHATIYDKWNGWKNVAIRF